MTTIETLYDELRAYKRSRVLAVAIKQGLLKCLMQKPKTIEEIAQERKIPPKTLKIFLNALQSLGLILYSNQFYTLTELGQRAAEDSTLHSFADYHSYCFDAWTLLPELCQAQYRYGMGFHQKVIQNTEFCKAYLKSMDAIASKQINSLVNFCKPLVKKSLLDIGAGPSTFGRYLADNKYCNVTAIDFPEIVSVAKEIYGTPDNFSWLGIDFMEYFPEQRYDTVYCGHLLEYFSGDYRERHLSHIKDVLVAGGSVIFVCFLREDNADCLEIDLDMFELSTCLNGPSVGQVLSISEIQFLLKDTGYDDIKINALSSGPSYKEYIITCKTSN